MQEEKAKLIQTILFVAGINTLLQTVFGTRLPAVIGASYTFVPVTISIMLSGRFNDVADPVDVRSFTLVLYSIVCVFFLSARLLVCSNIPFLMNYQRFTRIIRATQGALIVASTFQIILGFSGLWRNVVRSVFKLTLDSKSCFTVSVKDMLSSFC